MNNMSEYILFSEFISGVLLEKKEIASLEFIQLLNLFNDTYPNVEVIEPDNDFMKIASVVEFDKASNKIRIIEGLDYNSTVVDNNAMTVTDFLVKHTNKNVLDFLENAVKKKVKA